MFYGGADNKFTLFLEVFPAWLNSSADEVMNVVGSILSIKSYSPREPSKGCK